MAMPPFTFGTPRPSGAGDTTGPMHGDLGLHQGQGLQVTRYCRVEVLVELITFHTAGLQLGLLCGVTWT